MKLSLNSLKQQVDVAGPPEALAEQFTRLGLEVENVRRIAGAFDGIVVAQVITREKHPNADKLSLCRVNDGTGERQIVCGAHNFQAGDKVPLILPGAALPPKPGENQPFVIKVGKIRGVESHGMMCSPQELGLPDQVDGLLILRTDATVGQPFAEYLGRDNGDFEYELEIPADRPDLNNPGGLARELATVTGSALKAPNAPTDSGKLREIPLRHLKVAALLGLEIPEATQIQLLQGVGVSTTPQDLATQQITFSIPASRDDLKTELDLIEEIGRLYGLDKIPGTGAAAPLETDPSTTGTDPIRDVRRTLTELGLEEAQSHTLLAKAEHLGATGTAALTHDSTEVLRPSLLPGLLTALGQSVRRMNPDARVFEIGSVFMSANGAPNAGRRIAMAMTGSRLKPLWTDDAPSTDDGHDLKKLVEHLLKQFGGREVTISRRAGSTPLFVESAVLTLGENVALGEFGQVLPAFAEKFDLRDPVHFAELNLDLLKAGPKSYRQ